MVNGVVQAAFVEHSLCSLTFMMRDSVKNTVWRCIFCSIYHRSDRARSFAPAWRGCNDAAAMMMSQTPL